MRGAPHSGLPPTWSESACAAREAYAADRCDVGTSTSRRDESLADARATTVAGFTRTVVVRHPDQRRESQTPQDAIGTRQPKLSWARAPEHVELVGRARILASKAALVRNDVLRV